MYLNVLCSRSAMLRYIHSDVDLLPHGKPRTAFLPIVMMLYRHHVHEYCSPREFIAQEQNAAQELDRRHRTHADLLALRHLSESQPCYSVVSTFSSSSTAGEMYR